VAGVVEDGVRVFKGLPFAAPPVGELRWRPPQPVVPWAGVRRADTFGPQCPQLPYPAGSPYTFDRAPTSEDCLYLNVWTTAGAHERQPVMVWVHGGAWTRGSASQTTGGALSYDGAALARKGVVVVTVNYRLGPFGFFAHPDLTAESPQRSSGNYAILDHIAALEWVRDNIAAFGGNPANVTVFGQSAGAWSVNATQATPLARGLFHRVIGESGAQLSGTQTLAAAEQNGADLATAVGADSLDALRAVPAERLLLVPAFRAWLNVDGWVLPDEVQTLFAQRRHSHVPVLVGSNANEWTTLADPATFPKTMEAYRRAIEMFFPGMAEHFDGVYPVTHEADIPGALQGLWRDTWFTLPMRTWARRATAGGQPAYLYQFTHVPPSPDASVWGAYHVSEVQYVFGNLNVPTFRYTDTDRALSETMSSYWVNFATHGDPNGAGLPRWTPYDREAEPYLDLGATVQPRHRLLKAQLDFLERAQQRASPASG